MRFKQYASSYQKNTTQFLANQHKHFINSLKLVVDMNLRCATFNSHINKQQQSCDVIIN